MDGAAPDTSTGDGSGADRLLLLSGLNLNLPRPAGFRDRDLDVENAVLQLAFHVVDIEAGGQGDGGVEAAVRELRPGLAVHEAFGQLAFAFDHELIVLHGDVDVFFRDAGNNRADVQKGL